MRNLPTLILLALAWLLAGGAQARAVQTEHVEAELIAERTAAEPGRPLRVALRLKMDEHWHTYWRNPGDTGLPTTIQWQLPAGFQPGEIEWPAPHRIDVGSFANYGYEGEVVLPVLLAVPAGLPPGAAIPIKARADWLVCREQCIPGGADLVLDVPIAAASDADARWAGLFATAWSETPRDATAWQWNAYRTGGRLDLVWQPPAGSATPSRVQFFPHAEGLIEPAARQALYRLPDGRLRLNVALSKQAAQLPASVDGVLTTAGGWGKEMLDGARAVYLSAGVENTLPQGAHGGTPLDAAVTYVGGAGQDAPGLVAAIALALIGGLILNLMPCVFPVISLKVLGFSQQAHGKLAAIRMHGLVFAAGVVLSFVALAGVVLALRAGGQELGWGFQLQSPAVVTALAILFFLLTLNIAGYFETSTLVPGGIASFSARNPYVNSFLSGVLAVVIASPCTAPFMGAALGFALAQPPAASLAVFVALGLGMALPYLLLAWFPAWLKRLPKPGPWMVWLKQLLAIPLAATVIWLGWVLAQQSGADAFARLLFVLLLLAVGIWCARQRLMARHVSRVLAIGAVLVAGWLAWPLIDDAAAAEAKAVAAGDWQPWSRARLDELVSAGQPVFVDFTAAWCVSCQANKKLVLEREDAIRAFADKKVVLLRADWTRRDPGITAALAGFGRSGVPVYALYRPGKSTLILPEILTPGGLREALGTL
ncbi:MAG: thioredoxin family protein [Betaproteobacteria bacterium]|nr:thioredoxin family protein [Betaproteobacteria bacterium]